MHAVLAKLLLVLVPVLILLQPVRAKEKAHEFEFQYYKTEPSLRSPVITFKTRPADESALSPGYIFLDTRSYLRKGLRLSALVYDNHGTLIWNGNDMVSEKATRTQNTHVCDFLGKKGAAVCISEVTMSGKGTRANNRIFDQSYRQVGAGNYSNIDGWKLVNPHEFKDTNNGHTFVQAVYHPREYDLTAIGGNKRGLVLDGCFQEVDVKTGREVFRWCGLDHFKAEESTHSGTRNAKSASVKSDDRWDALHLNAVDKNEEGDYLVSIRYLNGAVKVAGPNARKIHGVEPGTVLWIAGGPKGQFKFKHHENEEWNLQHDIRFISTGNKETLFSLHDNHGAGGSLWSSKRICKAKIVRVNNRTMEGKLLSQYPLPEPLHCTAMGSTRQLPNGNVFVGWGKRPFFSEFAENGTLLLHAQFTKKEHVEIYNYRSLKFNWTATPHWSPKLLAYSRSCRNSKLVCYVSWNGATEVHSWRFHVSTTDLNNGPWLPLGTFKKTGFETKVELVNGTLTKFTDFVPFVSAEALDVAGNVLGTVYNSTWVPKPQVRDEKCNEEECFKPEDFAYNADWNRADTCDASLLPSIMVLAIVLLGIESALYSSQPALDFLAWRWREGDDSVRPLLEEADGKPSKEGCT